MGNDSVWIQAGIRMELGQLRSYLDALTKALTMSTQTFVDRIETEAQEMPEEERDEYYDWHSDTHWELTEVFPSLLNNSLFVAICSYLEPTLNNISKRLEKKNPQGIKMKDLRGDGIEQYRVFLKKVHSIDFPDTSIEWQNITIYQKARNFIIHNDRKLDDTSNAKTVKEFVLKNPTLMNIDAYDQIEVFEKGNRSYIDDIEKFLLDLIDRSGL